ncbi:uncharacterized protein LOC124940605 [Impatiens glandulifera]|uniref:uncharacterized protein LOC124940605 n=1 Tax=Impatiens glandulifera TaxID=253017 RepID=UPI001FB08335|nr:uncharacterized protein LOC124940605 [Impatiens glandulifera]
MDYSCAEVSPPVQDKQNRTTESIFDPCHWAECGGGSCNRTSMFTYSCNCREGYLNLLNITTFPCYKDCAIGMDCLSLGIPVSNKSSSPPPHILSNNNTNQANWRCTNNMAWLISILMILGSVILW